MHTLPQRKPIRFPGFDYSHGGFYVVTICTQNRINYFGEIVNGQMRLNHYGYIVNQVWQWVSRQYPYIILDTYIIMPNHFHGIVFIDPEHMPMHANGMRAVREPPLPGQRLLPMEQKPVKSLSRIVGAFKTRSSKLIYLAGLHEFQWQRSFFDNIIRNETQLENFRWYIRENPMRWWRDRNNLK